MGKPLCKWLVFGNKWLNLSQFNSILYFNLRFMEKVSFTRELDLKINSAIGDLVNKVTCQLFLPGGKFSVSPLGSGVFVTIGTLHYILTAAHVAEKHRNPNQFLVLQKNGKFLEIKGDCQYTNYRNLTKIDVAYIKISNELKVILSDSFEFLSQDKIIGSHQLMDAANYAVFGYPEKNVVKKKDGYIHTKASLYILKPLEEKVYKYYNFDYKLFYTMGFKGKGIDLQTGRKSRKLKKQNGLSGCGLWFMNVEKEEDGNFNVDFFLIGIMTDEPVGKYHCLIGNKIDVLLSAIANLDKNESANLIKTDNNALYIHHKTN